MWCLLAGPPPDRQGPFVLLVADNVAAVNEVGWAFGMRSGRLSVVVKRARARHAVATCLAADSRGEPLAQGTRQKQKRYLRRLVEERRSSEPAVRDVGDRDAAGDETAL